MRKALTHCCHRCDWHQTSVISDAKSSQQESFDHCPRCRSPELFMRQATRLETLVASAARLGTANTYRQYGKLILSRVNSPCK